MYIPYSDEGLKYVCCLSIGFAHAVGQAGSDLKGPRGPPRGRGRPPRAVRPGAVRRGAGGLGEGGEGDRMRGEINWKEKKKEYYAKSQHTI